MYTDKKVYKYISQKRSDPIVEWKTCAVSGKEFAIFQSDLGFYKKISPSFVGKRFQIPIPTLCPEERHRRRLMFKNERFLHKDACESTNESMISRFTDKHVYCNKERHSDKREQKYLDYNKNKSVYDHISGLVDNTIYQNLIGSSANVLNNAEYVNHASKQSNTYLLSNARDDEFCAYGLFVNHCKRTFDSHNISHSENCYQCVSCTKLFKCIFCYNCSDSSNLHFCADMIGCSFCVFSSGLQNQSYCIYNKQVDKDTYKKFIDSLNIGSYKSLEKCKTKYRDILMSRIHLATHNTGSSDAIGNECNNSEDVIISFELQECQNVKYTSTCFESKDLMDVSAFGELSNRMYECSQSGKNSSNLIGCNMIGESHNLLYCMETTYCRDCFGCVNLYKKQYCIFNKQYEKEEYEKIVGEIIEKMIKSGEWGEFFDYSLSPFPYNDTPAVDFFPPKYIIDHTGQKSLYSEKGCGILTLNNDNEIATGLLNIGGKKDISIKWRMERKIAVESNSLRNDEIPDHIDEFADDLKNKTIYDKSLGKSFRIISIEYDFYKRNGIAISREHPDKRLLERIRISPGKTLYLINCDSCKKEILSVYGTQNKKTIYCKSCYNKELYG